jgi:uncharacterized membrane protein
LLGARGQVFVFAAVSMVAICAMAGFAIDVGSWYRVQRSQQAIADSSALAAAAALPGTTTAATAAAQTFATKSGGSSPQITYTSVSLANDTVTVKAVRRR